MVPETDRTLDSLVKTMVDPNSKYHVALKDAMFDLIKTINPLNDIRSTNLRAYNMSYDDK